MAKSKNQNGKVALMLTVLALLAAGLLVWTARRDPPTSTGNNETPKTNAPTSNMDVRPKENVLPDQVWPKQLSSEESANLTVVVNKKHKLPADYIPQLVNIRGFQLRNEASSELEQLLSDADSSNVSLKIISAYRSYDYQQQVYGGYVTQYGEEKADTISARPGHSEHQTGLAVDLGASNGACDLEICFESTPAGEWIKSNAKKYGFIVRYQKDKDISTGYQYEPWHLRYVGTDIADKINASGQTLDEYFGFVAGEY